MTSKNTYSIVGTVLSIAAIWIISHFSPNLYHFFELNSEHALIMTFFLVGSIFALSFIVFYISHVTSLPSFVIAIFFGLAAHNLLKPIVEHHETLGALVGFGATLILFSGGLETPFRNFKKLFFKIFSLSFPGLLITAFLFSTATILLNDLFNLTIPLIVAVLLGAVLASTDPAAIIPVLKRLRFHNRSTKDIIISESALTDVTGTLLTIAFLGLIATGTNFTSLGAWYREIFSAASGLVLLKQIAFGILLGVAGYIFLETLQKLKKRHAKEFEADSAFFLFVPVIIFTIALSLGGSGYLAAFIAGLIFNLTEHLHETERFFNHVIDGFFKPTIFILLGALVNPAELLSYAGIGIVVALIFMFIIRPITILIALGPFSLFGQDRLTFKELLFISFVRETGAIPAVLMVTIASLKLGDISGLVPIGMWVILLTLIIEPILTPWVAKKLQVAEEISDTKKATIGGKSTVVLATRGHSFLPRLQLAADWAAKHNITELSILLCLEDRFNPELEIDIKNQAEHEMEKINTRLQQQSLSALSLAFVSRKGLLQENIEQLSEKNNSIVAIFVGRKVLDFRLNEIKQLHVPLYFLP